MLTEIDIYRSANVLIREHGEDAALDATTRAIALPKGKGFPTAQEVVQRLRRFHSPALAGLIRMSFVYSPVCFFVSKRCRIPLRDT